MGEYGRCSKDNQPGVTNDNNPLPVTKKQEESQAAETDSQATKAIGQIENVANKLKQETLQTKEDQKVIHGASTKAFNIIHALKDMIKHWHSRSKKHMEISEHARGVYRKKIAAIMKKRRHTLNIIRKVLDTEFKDEMDEAASVKDILTKENDNAKDTDGIDTEIDEKKAQTSDEVAPVIPEGLSNEDINLKGIAKFLTSMSKRDKVLMTNMHKVAQNNVEQELHKAAVRKMAREEAAWYSCSWLLEDPKSHQCADFHEEYNGPQRGRELTPEEHTRVCNEVQFRLKNLPKNKSPSDAVKGNRDKALAYCVSNVNVLCAKCK